MLDLIRITPGMCEKLSQWHGGQASATFNLLDNGGGNEEMIKKAVVEIQELMNIYVYKLSPSDKEELTNLATSLESLLQ